MTPFRISILFISIFFFNNTADAQIGIRIGGNFSSIDTKGISTFFIDDEYGFHAGITYEFRLSEKYSIETGPLLMFKSLPYDSSGGRRDAPTMVYGSFVMLEVPILLKRFVNIGEVPMDISAGPTFNYADDFTGFYAGLQTGIGVQVNDFHISAFYQLNLSPFKYKLPEFDEKSLYGSNFGISLKYNIFMKGRSRKS